MTTAAVIQQHTDTSIPQPPAAAYAFSAPPQKPPMGMLPMQTTAEFYPPTFTPAAAANAHPQRYPPNRAHAQPAMGPHPQTIAAPRQGAHGSGPSAPRGGHRYTVPTPLPPRRSLSAASPPTRMGATPSPLPGTPSTPLFPAQAGPLILPQLLDVQMAPPLRGTRVQGVVFTPPSAASGMPPRPPTVPDTPFTMFAPATPTRSMPVPAPPPPSSMPGPAAMRGRKIAPAPTRRAMPTLAPAPQATPGGATTSAVMPPPSLPPVKQTRRSATSKARPARTTNGSASIVPPTSLPVQPAQAGSRVASTAFGGRTPGPTDVATAVDVQLARQKRCATELSQQHDGLKRARPDAGEDSIITTKRAATDDTWRSPSTLDCEPSVPIGHRVQSNNNLISQQRSHALQGGHSGDNEAAPSSAPPEDDDEVDFLAEALKDEEPAAVVHAAGPTPARAPAGPAPAQGGLRLPLGVGVCPRGIAAPTAKAAPSPAPAASLLALPTGGGVRGVTMGQPAPVKRADGPSGAPSGTTAARALLTARKAKPGDPDLE
ncbi:hypothetical protein AURDEDRAFT_187468 [Auricularia subglabra TFB-10046 SS5]|nr:hypothetical protein AURDEDRAFT_187468 [Auricularia subglabra TFB-10046 SS5]